METAREKDHEFPWIEFDNARVYCTVCKSFRRMMNWQSFLRGHEKCGKKPKARTHDYLAGIGPFV